MTRARTLILAAMMLVGTAYVPAAAAQSTSSTVAGIKVLTSAHSKYRFFHGALWLERDKAQRNYRWGGQQCPNTDLSEMQISMLYSAFRSKLDVAVDYTEVGRYRCITGFTISR